VRKATPTDRPTTAPPATEAWAREQDRSDPLARFRDRFLLPRGKSGTAVYLCGNSLGLQPRGARELVEQDLSDWAELGVHGHFAAKTPWYSYHELLRQSAARLAGALPGEVVAMNSLTVNLHLMMSTFYRPTPARYRVLIEDHAFPSDIYAVASQIRRNGHDPADALIVARPSRGEDCPGTGGIEAILEERGEEIALVLLGGVNYYTGQAFDFARITAAAREKGCTVGWDLAHAIGNLPLRLHEWDVDFAVWCSYKYLNGGPGAVGGCFVHEKHGSDARLPRLAGWWGNDPDTRFAMREAGEFVPRAGADGWQVSNPPILSMAPLRASLAIFDEAGMQALREKSIRLTGFLETLLGSLDPGRFRVITPKAEAERGCQLSIRVRNGAKSLLAALSEADVIADLREPDVIRVAPVPLYNTFHDVWRFARILGEAAARTAGRGR
jgi:kynureninase